MLHTFANTQSASMKKRVQQYMLSSDCATCRGKRLRRESLSVTFAGLDLTELSRLPLVRLAAIFRPYAAGTAREEAAQARAHPEKAEVMRRISEDVTSGSSSPPSCSGSRAATRCTCSTSRPPASTPRTSSGSWPSSIGWWTPATR